VHAGQWNGVFAGHVWMLTQTSDSILYKSFCTECLGSNQAAANNASINCSKKYVSEPDCEKCVDHRKLLEDYFQLSVNLQEMYKDWGQKGYCISCCYLT